MPPANTKLQAAISHYQNTLCIIYTLETNAPPIIRHGFRSSKREYREPLKRANNNDGTPPCAGLHGHSTSIFGRPPSTPIEVDFPRMELASLKSCATEGLRLMRIEVRKKEDVQSKLDDSMMRTAAAMEAMDISSGDDQMYGLDHSRGGNA